MLSAEARFLRHDERLEPRLRPQRVQQPREPGSTVAELRARDPVVEVSVLLGDRPALSRRVGASVLELPLDRVAFVASAGLHGGFARVDRGDHRSRPVGRYGLFILPPAVLWDLFASSNPRAMHESLATGGRRG